MASITPCIRCLRQLRQQSRLTASITVRIPIKPTTPKLKCNQPPSPTTLARLPQISRPFSSTAATHLQGIDTSPPSASNPEPVNTALPVESKPSRPKTASTTSANPVYTDDRPSPTAGLAQSLRARATSRTGTYAAYAVTEILYKQCATQAEYTMPERGTAEKTASGAEIGIGQGWWYDSLHLTPTFNTWAQITALHMYLLTARLRCLPRTTVGPWQQHLLDHFFADAEARMVERHNMVAGMMVTRYLKDLHEQYRGAVVAYDEGVCRGDAVLAAALWRNLWGGVEDLDVVALAEVVEYVRRGLTMMDGIGDEDVLRGNVNFGPLRKGSVGRVGNGATVDKTS
ncbi:MAG: Protein cbp3, mitochondrial [Piccolia ochrophora]|nr:MAG: Protein cbp3, mitochondrial [Piccolia ochrophora]